MTVFTPNRIVVLDDQPAHLEAIRDAITALGSSCVCLQWRINEDPPAEPFSHARIIFMDLQLLDRSSTTDMRRHFGEIQRLLTKLINPDAGPFLLIIWTDKPEQVNALGSYLEEHLFTTHPHTRPVQLLPMSKTDFILTGTGAAKDPGALQAHILEQVERAPALAALLRWESEIIDASNRVAADVLQLAFAEPDDTSAPDLGVVLRRLASAAVGDPNVLKDPRAAVHSALFPLLEDHIQFEAVMDSPAQEQATPEQAESEDDPQRKATNSARYTDRQDSGREDAVKEATAVGSSEAVTSPTTAASDIWDAALSLTGPPRGLSRDEAGDINAHIHLGGNRSRLTATMWGAICELEEDLDWPGELGITDAEVYVQHVLGALKDISRATKPAPEHVRILQIRIGASCDYAQKVDGPIPYVIAAFVPLPAHAHNAKDKLGGHQLGPNSTCWITPILSFAEWGVGHLVVDPRYTRTRGEARAQDFVVVNRIREQLLMQLIGAVARHGDRPGIISLNGFDKP